MLLTLPIGYSSPSVAKFQVDQSVSAAPAPVIQVPVTPTYGIPTRVVIPSLSIDLPVSEGDYNRTAERWSVASGKQATYAANTAPVNNVAGDTLIYGHNNKNVFGALKNLSGTDSVLVYTDTGQVFEYSFAVAEVVEPTDTAALADDDGNADLKLLTCEGTWAQNRRIVSLTLINVQ